MPGPQAKNRLKKSPFMGKTPKKSRALRKMQETLKERKDGFNAVKNKTGFHEPGSENPRKR